MDKATETQLSALHGHVASTMTAALNTSAQAEKLLRKYEDAAIPGEVIRFLEQATVVNPSLLTAITKFLKDNDISCDIGSSDDLQELEASLARKRKGGSVTRLSFDD